MILINDIDLYLFVAYRSVASAELETGNDEIRKSIG